VDVFLFLEITININMEIILKVDNRERAIHEHLLAAFTSPPMFCINLNQPEFTQLDIGDFIIVANSSTGVAVLAVVERKTLKDYAASLKDGRMINTEKLIRLREETGCHVYYLIEGGINLAYDHQICGIEYYKILANIRDAQILHNIQIINTADKLHTAREMKFLVERYTKDYDSLNIKVTGSFDDIVERCKPTKQQEMKNELAIIWTNLMSKSKVHTKITPSTRGVTMASTFTIMKWIKGEITEEHAQAIKVNNRRLDGWQIEVLSQPMSRDLQLKALTCMKGISADFADGVLKTMTIQAMICNPETAKTVVLGNRKLGKANREKITTMFRSRIST
jgi:ERCC4-type nuclease